MADILLLRKEENSRHIPDEELVAACSEGDTSALGELFERYNKVLYRFISMLSGTDSEELDDLVQTTFIQVYKSSGRFAGRSSVKSWIFGIAVNVARRHTRSAVRRKSFMESLGELPKPESEMPNDKVERIQSLERLTLALDKLPHNKRAVFVMCYIEGIPGVEAAKILGVRQGTLWRWLHETRKTLADAIERRQI